MARRLLLVALLLWLSWASPAVGSESKRNEPLPADSLLTIVYTGESWGEYAPCPT